MPPALQVSLYSQKNTQSLFTSSSWQSICLVLGVWTAVQKGYVDIVSGESELPAAPQFPPPPAAFVPDSIDAAGPATANPTSTRAPRFHAGSRVLYDDREHGRLVQGTVAKLKSGSP